MSGRSSVKNSLAPSTRMIARGDQAANFCARARSRRRAIKAMGSPTRKICAAINIKPLYDRVVIKRTEEE
ncbi:co-chaperone GroES, partial [Salmonella enterica subsp. enterica serovar Typhimurium]|nr:co-chaperone GroES [Salmonella enterica subsp. enterica serovar Typhimurium]